MRSRVSKTGRVALLSLASTCACIKPNTNIELADADHQTPVRDQAGVAEHEADRGRRPHVERMHVAASVSGLGQMLDAGEQIYAQWIPSEPGAPPLDLQSLLDVALIQIGFDSAWFANVDLDGLHTVTLGLPHEDPSDGSMADYEFAATIAARNSVALVVNLPNDPPAEPLEQDLWQLVDDDDIRLLLRTRPGVLEAATSFTLLDSLAATRHTLAPKPGDPRVHLSMSGFDHDSLDLGPLFAQRQIDAARQQAILDELRVELHGDFGSDRDLTAHAALVAPFGDAVVGGPLLTDSSALAKLLPTGAWLVMMQSWAQPANLAELRKQIDLRKLPPPQVPLVEELLSRGDDLIAQLGSENALAIYVDRKGRATLVFLTTVANDQAASKAMGELFAALEKAASSVPGIVRATLQPDAFRAGAQRPDVLSIELPEQARDVLDGMPWLLGTAKPTLELSHMVGAGKLVIAIGPGQRELLATLGPRLAGSTDAGLERGGGLARARELTGGCQTCVAIDPIAIADGLLAILAASPDADRAFRKLLDSTRKRLLGLGLSGELSLAARFDPQRWELAASVPKPLLFLGVDVGPRVLESVEAIRDGYARTSAPTSEALCKHVLQVMEREMGTATVGADQLAGFLETCIKELDKEREKLGDGTFRKQAKCVLAAPSLDDMTKCESP